MLSHPAPIPLSSRTLNHLTDLIHGHRQQRKSRWRRPSPGRQVLLALACLRNGDTCTRLAGAVLSVVVTGIILSAHTDLTSGPGPALRTVALLVLAARAAVVAGYGDTAPTRTIATSRKRVLSRPVSR